MYQILTILIGALSALMIAANGSLTIRWGIFRAAVIVHIAGSLFALLLCLIRAPGKGKGVPSLWNRRPRWLYLGGVLGVLLVVLQNAACLHIPVTSVVALMLLGQIAASLAVDRFGLLGARRAPLRKSLLPGLACALAGVWTMLERSPGPAAAVAVCLALASGIVSVLSRGINARLAHETGPLRSSLVNHLTGLAAAAVLAVPAAGSIPANGPRCWPGVYFSGCLGVVIVLLYNITVPHISACHVTLFSFSAQVFTGILCDLWRGNSFSDSTLLGGIFIAAGIFANTVLEGIQDRREKKRQAYFRRIRDIERIYWRSILKKHQKQVEFPPPPGTDAPPAPPSGLTFPPKTDTIGGRAKTH